MPQRTQRFKKKKRDFSQNLDTLTKEDKLPIEKIEIETYKKSPPPLFNEATFVEALKSQKIGSESTFGAYVDKLLDKEKGKDGKPIIRGYAKTEKGYIVPTEKGIFFANVIPKETQDVLNILQEVA